MTGTTSVETDDVTDLFDEERVVGYFEMALAMGLYAEQIKPPVHRTFRDAGMSRHGAHAPVRTIRRRGLQGRVNDFGHTFVLVSSGTTGTQFIV